jgi:hypothetical protein
VKIGPYLKGPRSIIAPRGCPVKQFASQIRKISQKYLDLLEVEA